MVSTKPPSGMRDYLPDAVVKRRYVLGKIEGVFQRYGFLPLETPTMEHLATLLGKYGDEGDQLLYRVLHRGERLSRVLVHRQVAEMFLPLLASVYRQAGVEMRGCAVTRAILPDVLEATEADWDTEYLDLIVALRVVASLEEAIAHINQHGSGHTDTILTEDPEAAAQFLDHVDSATVMHNASTRFADGFRFGKGAEVGISTNKTHARGPVGLDGLVIYKYRLVGQGHVVADYVGPQARPFTHRGL